MAETSLILIMLVAFAAGYLVGHVRGAVARRKQAVTTVARRALANQDTADSLMWEDE